MQCTAAKLFKEFDKDSNGKLTLTELETSVQAQLPDLANPNCHVLIFHMHLTYFTEEGYIPSCVYPSHWQAGFDLIECDAIMSSEKEDDEKDYTATFQRAKRALATEQLAALVLRTSADNILQVLIDVGRRETGSTEQPDILKAISLDQSLPELQWKMLQEHGDMTPDLDLDISQEVVVKDITLAMMSLRDKLAARGGLLLAVLLASHKLSIEKAFHAFCLDEEGRFSFNRFREIMRRLAPDFGAASPRIESLFLSLTDPTDSERKYVAEGKRVEVPCVAEGQWVKVLGQAASKLSNKQYESILLQKGTSASDAGSGSANHQGADTNDLAGGERSRLRDVFFEPKLLEPSHGDNEEDSSTDQSNPLQKNRLFINDHQLKTSLAKMGVCVPAPCRWRANRVSASICAACIMHSSCLTSMAPIHISLCHLSPFL